PRTEPRHSTVNDWREVRLGSYRLLGTGSGARVRDAEVARCGRHHARKSGAGTNHHLPALRQRRERNRNRSTTLIRLFNRRLRAGMRIVPLLIALSMGSGVAVAQQPPAAPTAATAPRAVVKPVADGVYIFEFAGYQSMFVVDPGGVLITDPISPAAATAYLAEVRKITSAPIRYVVYSHHHYDHIAGAAPFKDAGAIVVAHRNARAQLERLKNPRVVLPDQLVDNAETLTLGRTRVDLLYMGRNHSDNSLVVSVPSQKVIYAADWLPVGDVIGRNICDAYIDEWFAGIDRGLALDWEKLIVGHVRAHNPKGWGTKDDV